MEKDFTVGETTPAQSFGYETPVEVDAPEEYVKDKLTPVTTTKKRKSRVKKLTTEEAAAYKTAILETLDSVLKDLKNLSTLARSLKLRGVRVSIGDLDKFYQQSVALIQDIEYAQDKMTTELLTLNSAFDTVRILEHIAREWCSRNRLIYIEMTWRQKQKARALAAKPKAGRNPIDYLGGYFYSVLFEFRGYKKFSWSVFLNEERVAEWIHADLKRRQSLALVGHYRYDSDLDVEAFYNRYLTFEERLKNDTARKIAEAFDNRDPYYCVAESAS